MTLIKVCVLVAIVAATTATTEFQLTDYFEITRNDYQNNEVSGRSDGSIEANVEEYIKSHDATFRLPIIGSALTVGARNLDNDEVDVKLRFNTGNQVDARGKKHKLKKIFVPILVFILIKAMVMIPLALGILAIKTWNALQLSFVSFVIALAMSVWQLCKKFAGDHHHHPHIVAHEPWDVDKYGRRNFDTTEAQKMAYSAYMQ